MLKILILLALSIIPPSYCIAANLNLTSERLIDAQNVPRYGLNLGGPSYWGAEQLRANIVRNPGFMPLLDRSIVIVEQKEGWQIKDKDSWVGRSDGFWTGGNYQVLSGEQAGEQGRIRDYRRKGQENGYFWLDKALPALIMGDALSVEKISSTQAIPQWWSNGRVNLVPYAASAYAARLQPSANYPAQLASYFDTLGGEAGRLLPINGEWQLRFKVRSERSGAKLSVRFARDKMPAFVQENIEPKSEWQSVNLTWKGLEGLSTVAAPLSLTFQAEGDGEIWLDEVYLGEKDPLPGGFRRAVVDTVKTLRPGYLRDWQGQLGDNVSNRFIGEFERHPIRYRPGDNESFFAYSIPDLFALCTQVQAQPWVIGPPTLSSSEWFSFGQRLRIEADKAQLREVVLEFGNENWNALFRPAGLSDVKQHQQVADSALAAAKRGFGSGRQLITVVNAPFLWGDSPGAIVNSTQADRVAVAPYFLYEISGNDNEKTLRQRALSSQLPLLLKQQQLSKAKNKQLAIYEINFHSTLGNAPAALRNSILKNAISGVALARQLIDASLAGLREQAVYSLAGFSVKLDKNLGDIALFGITRDLAQANRFRPTGVALAMLNEIAGGQAHSLRCNGELAACSQISAILFKDAARMRFAIVNAAETAHTMNLPCASKAITWALLDGSQSANHELESTRLIRRGKVNCAQNQASIVLPPQSLLIAKEE
ncbi:hypothetical protein HQ393_05680 [Chitinibacter bivalviorum]|uniref:Uncharacterized protein n=1 Tax=Chitinibacter bivalviorum TaxID=2739434 RepID=A0A7H9BGP6_9NEIS|nr:hypothetical protein [Chitinibacter bivalviorum]QLG87787.1 hypothetical protein HQ393_05680 [Chitinibacter bivalviorum]